MSSTSVPSSIAPVNLQMNARGSVRNDGSMTFSASESWVFVDGNSTPTSKIFTPGASGLPRLDYFSTAYELWRVKSVRVRYEPTAGTQIGGVMYLGTDYDPYDLATTNAEIQQLLPRIRVAPWQRGTMMLDIGKINKGRWMYTAPTAGHDDLQKGFAITWFGTSIAGPVGELFCDYVIEFSSPKLPSTLPASVTTKGELGFIVGSNNAVSTGSGEAVSILGAEPVPVAGSFANPGFQSARSQDTQ